MDWTQVITILASNLLIMLSILGLTVRFHLYEDRKLDEFKKETNGILQSIHDEMKDFHYRLLEIEKNRKA